jgi:DNA polymerase III subunit epsilon
MENICVLDTETTGLDPEKGKVIEVAGILFNIPTRTILAQTSVLCYAESNAAYDINRIEVDALKKIDAGLQVAGFQMLREMLVHCDAIVAHNAEFDKKWINTLIDFQDLVKFKKWICTRNDVIWPIRKGIPLNLVHICVDLGVPIVNAHRALSDCQLLVDALQCVDDIESFLDKSGKGRITYHAQINYDQRQIVKDAGFMWDNIKKVWHAKMTPEQASTLPFTVYPAENSCVIQ